MQSAVRERVDDAELLADRRRQDRNRRAAESSRSRISCASPMPVRAPSSCLRVTGSDSVNSAEPLDDSCSRPPQPSSTAKNTPICVRFWRNAWYQTKPRKSFCTSIASRIMPREARGFGRRSFRRHVELRQQPLRREIVEDVAAGHDRQDHQRADEAPPRFEPRFVPQHVSPPSLPTREKCPSASPATTSIDVGR